MLEKNNQPLISVLESMKLGMKFIGNVTQSVPGATDTSAANGLEPWKIPLIVLGTIGGLTIILLCLKKTCSNSQEDKMRREIAKGDKQIDQLHAALEDQKTTIVHLKAAIQDELNNFEVIKATSTQNELRDSGKTKDTLFTNKGNATSSTATHRSSFFNTETAPLITTNPATTYSISSANNVVERRTKTPKNTFEDLEVNSKEIKEDVHVLNVTTAQILDEQESLKNHLDYTSSTLTKIN